MSNVFPPNRSRASAKQCRKSVLPAFRILTAPLQKGLHNKLYNAIQFEVCLAFNPLSAVFVVMPNPIPNVQLCMNLMPACQ